MLCCPHFIHLVQRPLYFYMESQVYFPNNSIFTLGFPQLMKRNTILLCILLCTTLKSFLGNHYTLNTIQINQYTIESAHLLLVHTPIVVFTLYSHPVSYPILLVLPIDVNLVFAPRATCHLNVMLDICNIREIAVQHILIDFLRKTLIFCVRIHTMELINQSTKKQLF